MISFSKYNRRFFTAFTVLLPAVFFIFTFSSCTKCTSATSDSSSASKTRTEVALGTVCTITLFNTYNGAVNEESYDGLLDELFERLDSIEHIFSKNIDDSELSLINGSASTGSNPVKVSDEMLFVLEKALFYAEKTDGALNPALGALVELWGIGTTGERVPTQEEIDSVLPLCDYHDIVIDKTSKTVFLKKAGMKLDLGAVVKGYAADELAKTIREYGIASALIDLGGNIYAVGSRNSSSWRIGVKNPFDTSKVVIRVDGIDFSVVTSGVYERYFEADGKRYHHILDSKTGYPSESGLVSTTIITCYPEHSSLDADSLSTAVFVLGAEKGIALLDELGLNGIVITSEKQVISANGQKTMTIKLLDDSFFEQ